LYWQRTDTIDEYERFFFDDVHGWSVGWVEGRMKLNGSGVGNEFDPNRPITRAESAKVIAKMMEYWDTEINNLPKSNQ
jgi:hypothetical protein